MLCNNAGGGESGWFRADGTPNGTAWRVWRRYVELNLNSVYIVSREIVPRMVAGGAVCNTSSIAGWQRRFWPHTRRRRPRSSPIPARWRSRVGRIRVNAVAPNLIYTKIWEELGAAIGGFFRRARDPHSYDGAHADSAGQEQTLKISSNTVAFLCSDRAANITGQVVAVDGGMVLGRRTTPVKRYRFRQMRAMPEPHGKTPMMDEKLRLDMYPQDDLGQ